MSLTAQNYLKYTTKFGAPGDRTPLYTFKFLKLVQSGDPLAYRKIDLLILGLDLELGKAISADETV